MEKQKSNLVDLSSLDLQQSPARSYRRVKTSATFSQDEINNFEIPTGPSETVPEMVVDLRLMLNRRASGMPIPAFDAGYSEEDYPDFFKMDEFELSEYRLNLANQMQEMSQQLHETAKALEIKHDENRKNVVTNNNENPVSLTETKPE